LACGFFLRLVARDQFCEDQSPGDEIVERLRLSDVDCFVCRVRAPRAAAAAAAGAAGGLPDQGGPMCGVSVLAPYSSSALVMETSVSLFAISSSTRRSPTRYVCLGRTKVVRSKVGQRNSLQVQSRWKTVMQINNEFILCLFFSLRFIEFIPLSARSLKRKSKE